jgi:hypothetical protein
MKHLALISRATSPVEKQPNSTTLYNLVKPTDCVHAEKSLKQHGLHGSFFGGRGHRPVGFLKSSR